MAKPHTAGATSQNDCRIAVIGIGKAGSNTVSRLTDMGVAFAQSISVNTDTAKLKTCKAKHRVLVNGKLVKCLMPLEESQYARALEELRRQIEDLLHGIDIVFITVGLSEEAPAFLAPFVAEIAKRKGAVTVGVVARPSRGRRGRDERVVSILNEMREQCHTVVVIDNNKLTELLPRLLRREARRLADKVIAKMIKGVVETISAPSLDNFDFKTVFCRSGMAIIDLEDDSSKIAEKTVQEAVKTPLIHLDYVQATGNLLNPTGDNRITIEDANRVGEIVTGTIDDDALVIWGARVNPQIEGNLKYRLLMTGVNSTHASYGLGAIAPQLFNLEPSMEPERPLGLKLDLYQMETF